MRLQPFPISRFLPPHLEAARATLRSWRWRLAVRGPHAAKRALDLLLVVPALLMLAPLLALVALAVRLQDGGPAFYWQKRVGLHGREFDFPKFRSMVVDAAAVRRRIESLNQHGSDAVTFKLRRDPRVTFVGRFLRRSSIDELPQLWCVLRGEMTLVGPRPPLPAEVQRYTPEDRHRLSVQPGLTCIWQVSGRADVPFEQQVQMDLTYIRQRSLVGDLRLLFQTIPAVLFGRGAY